jgi:5-formyltetrahydrofolate cyclo-ligase
MLGKTEIRKKALHNRKSLGKEERREKSAQILREILSLPVYCTSRTIMVYLDFRDEVETSEIAREILRTKKRLIIPYCHNQDIIACEISDLSQDVRPGMLGIREPRPEKLRTVSPREIDLALVPGVAFDYQGNRIGFGKGYYDRFLPKLREDTLTIGLAFCCQLVEKIEAEEHDYKMSLLITENGVIYPE